MRETWLMVAVAATVLALCVPNEVGGAEEPSFSAQAAEPLWLYFFGSPDREPWPLGNLDDAQKLAERFSPALGQFTVQSSFVDREAKGDVRVLWNFIAKSSAYDLKLMGEGDLGPAPFAVDGSQRLVRLGLAGTWEKFDYGAEYRLIPKGFEKLSVGPLGSSKSLGGSKIEGDQQGLEMWTNRDLGPFRLKTSLSRFSNNVDEDPNRGVTTTMNSRVAVDTRLPLGPILTLSYESALAETSLDARSPVAQRVTAERFGASLYYWGGPAWDVTLSSTSSPSRDQRRTASETVCTYYSFSAAYRPLAALTLEPTVGFAEERYAESRVTRETPYLSLALTYAPPSEAFNLSTWVSYSKSKTSDGQVDVDTLDVTGSLAWNIARWSRGRQVLSIDVTHGQNRDAIYRNASYFQTAAFLRFRAVSF